VVQKKLSLSYLSFRSARASPFHRPASPGTVRNHQSFFFLKLTRKSLALVRIFTITYTVIITFDFSHFTFNFHSTFTCHVSQDLMAFNLCLFPHHISTSTAFCSVSTLPVVPVKHRHGLLAVKYRMFQICVSNCIECKALLLICFANVPCVLFTLSQFREYGQCGYVFDCSGMCNTD